VDALALTWADVDFEQGTIKVFDSKTKTPRVIPILTRRLAASLYARRNGGEAGFVFASRGAKYRVSSLDHLHVLLRSSLNLPRDFVLHSCRHTLITRLNGVRRA
jgi:integrase